MLKAMKSGSIGAWSRRRDLASNRRSGQFSRSEAARLQYAWLRRNWRIVGAQVGLVLAVVPLVLYLPGSWRGAAAAAWLTTGLWLLAFQVVLASGTAPRMMGDRGEQFTASELRRMRRRGWRVINHVSLKRHLDIDHVAIGSGGVLVMETKWSGDPWMLDGTVDERVGRAVDRVGSQATDIRRMFPNHVAPTAIVPVLVLLGGYNPDEIGMRVIEGVTVIRGAELREWLAAQTADVTITTGQQDHVWRTLESQVRGRDAFDLKEDGRPSRTPGEAIGAVTRVAFTAWLGLVLSASASRLPDALFVPIEFTFVVGGWLAIRYTERAPVAIAWLVSVLAIGALVAAAVVSRVL
jgi:hypothetical protein